LFEIAGIEIRNDLEYPVTEVQVLVPDTGEFVSCGSVFARTSCAAAFPLREYRANALRITWKEHGQLRSVDDFVLQAPAALDAGRPVWVQVVIFAPGQAGARLLRERDTQR
jgi:hypothetical protein